MAPVGANGCTVQRADGQPCKGYPVWDALGFRCVAHGGRIPAGATRICRCTSYRFPHRLGGGGCNGPDWEPRYRCGSTKHKDRSGRRRTQAAFVHRVFGSLWGSRRARAKLRPGDLERFLDSV